MKIAIPYENGQVFQHFGHSAQFKLYTTEEGRITGAEVVSTDGQGHGALVGFLVRNGVNVLHRWRWHRPASGCAAALPATPTALRRLILPARWSLTPTPAAPTTTTRRATAAALTPATPTRAAAPVAATKGRSPFRAGRF